MMNEENAMVASRRKVLLPQFSNNNETALRYRVNVIDHYQELDPPPLDKTMKVPKD